ncbi:hypothetical protein HY251_17110, partial [bacterium]|nr:hypothetical protein [bacterium]
ALARLKDARALPTLESMLDRENLKRIQKPGAPDDSSRIPMDDNQRDDVMINALRGINELDAKDELPRVSAVADGDPSYKVRDAAMKVRDFLKGAPRK